MNPETKICQNCKGSFVIDASDFDFYEKMQVPPPTWCPDCRMMRRMIFWNERNFFKKIEKRTGKEILSQYPPESPIEIYDRDYWWSDAWDPLSYGKEIDFSQPILAQIRQLQTTVPWAAKSLARCVNSDYSNNAADIKNCYLCFNADQSEDSFYSVGILKLKNSLNLFRAEGAEFCYDGRGMFNSHQCFFSTILYDCRNVWFSYDCKNCSDCFGCVNLRNKQYYIFNKPYSKEEYFARIAQMNLDSYASITKAKKELEEFTLKFPRKFMTGTMNQNVTGDYIRSSKNALRSYALSHCENVKYSQSILMGAKDSFDYTNWGDDVEMTYETHACGGGAANVRFSVECWGGCNDIEYSMMCIGSSHLFACVGLRNKKYCILNKQYSKEEYEALVPKLRQQMLDVPYVDARGLVYRYGEFFPPEFSPFAANESAVIDFVDMDKERAESNGLTWREAKPKEYQVTLQAADLPDRISEASDGILKEIIACNSCKKGYRIVAGELAFLQRFKIPLPRECFNCRQAKSNLFRNKPVFYPGSCHCSGLRDKKGIYQNVAVHAHGDAPCDAEFQTTYAPDRPEIVYCEACYQQEVV